MRSLEAALGLSKDVKEGDAVLPWGDQRGFRGGVSNDSSDFFFFSPVTLTRVGLDPRCGRPSR